MNAAKIAEATRYRIELILTGMVLAKSGDRERILDHLSSDSIANPTLRRIIEGVRHVSANTVFEALEEIGIAADGCVLDRVLKCHEDLVQEDWEREAVAMILTSSVMEDRKTLEQRLEAALDFLRNKSNTSETPFK